MKQIFGRRPAKKKAVPGFAGVSFAFQKKQTVRFATALPILAAEQCGYSLGGYFLSLIKGMCWE
jgi:hypothetical protein